MSTKNALGKFQIAVRSTTSTNGKCIVGEDNISTDSSDNSNYSDNDEDSFIMDNIYLKSISDTFHLDSIMVSIVH